MHLRTLRLSYFVCNLLSRVNPPIPIQAPPPPSHPSHIWEYYTREQGWMGTVSPHEVKRQQCHLMGKFGKNPHAPSWRSIVGTSLCLRPSCGRGIDRIALCGPTLSSNNVESNWAFWETRWEGGGGVRVWEYTGSNFSRCQYHKDAK
jgi:hypothetical protein